MIYEVLGKELRRLRTEMGLTIAQVAKQLKVSELHYGEIERGKRRASFILIMRMCSELGLSQEFITDYAEKAGYYIDIRKVTFPTKQN